MRRLALVALVALLTLAGLPSRAFAQDQAPLAGQAETIRSELTQAQLALLTDPASAKLRLKASQQLYEDALGPALAKAAPPADMRTRGGFADAARALDAGDKPAFAAARADIWTSLLAGGFEATTRAAQVGDAQAAQRWLPLREFRTATRFSRADADATLAIAALAAGRASAEDALQAVRADLLDTYQARLTSALHDLAGADQQGYAARRGEFAALAQGYFAILAPTYAEQRGAEALATAERAFAELRAASLAGQPTQAPLAQVEQVLGGFRAAPLDQAEQIRRAGQLLRFLSLVPVEYGRGVSGGLVTKDLEIREATTFRDGAAAAFADLRTLLDQRDPAKTEQVATLFAALDQQLRVASQQTEVADPDAVQANSDQIAALLAQTMPAEWQKHDSAADFDVIATALDQMQAAVEAGQYELAESARLEAYAILESGPEAKLIVFAPQHKAPLEDLFWYGQGEQKGLAYLIGQRAPATEISASRKALDAELALAQAALAGNNAPISVASNAAIIVFREGLEAVLILASLMGSMKIGQQRRFRRPLWWGAAGAFLASALTWLLARELLTSLARYGERLEAIVSLIAIGVLLLITNWFFHKVYWTGWIASFHTKKRQLIGGDVGQWLGLALLGFTSIYREGFETVLFLQALVLEAGGGVVLSGVALGLAGTLLVGFVVFALQAKLPYKKMLIATGIMIGAVLLQMVGNTVHVMQVVGWMPIHPIRWLELPYWAGMWFGLYATWEGIGLQASAAVFVIGSYVLAERLQHRQAKQPRPTGAPSQHAPARSLTLREKESNTL
ncbi:MAG TPA: FTR1 family protein [Roseiflexaceae bacterium]|nr:FTR1 family protein [Roseiflexaceae bacterium]